VDEGGFRTLQQRWYKRLARSGFRDIEFTRNQQRRRRRGSPFLQKTPASSGLRQRQLYAEEYFRLAGWFLHDHDWSQEPAKAKMIWTLHATQDMFYPQIAKKVGLGRGTVGKIVRRLAGQMRGAYVGC
jgi:DNA-directed RNA polymerase specialized sigma24 family protein